MRYRLIITIALPLILLDQASKWLVMNNIAPNASIAKTSFFNLVHVYNYGAAFGFLNDPDTVWQRWMFVGVTMLAGLVIFAVARQAAEKERMLFAALGCVLGGAFGNLVDRLRFGAVVDFLDLHYAGWHWPAFNVADIAICVGAGFLALCVLRPQS